MNRLPVRFLVGLSSRVRALTWLHVDRFRRTSRTVCVGTNAADGASQRPLSANVALAILEVSAAMLHSSLTAQAVRSCHVCHPATTNTPDFSVRRNHLHHVMHFILTYEQ